MMFGLGFGVSFVFLFVGPAAGVVKVVLAYPRSIVPFNVFLLIPTQFGLQNNLNMPIAFQGPTPFLMKEVRSTRHYSYYYCDWLWQGKQAGGNRRRVPKREQHYESHLNQRRHTGQLL